MCQGFSHLPGFLLHFVLAKLATNSIRVKIRHVWKYKAVFEKYLIESCDCILMITYQILVIYQMLMLAIIQDSIRIFAIVLQRKGKRKRLYTNDSGRLRKNKSIQFNLLEYHGTIGHLDFSVLLLSKGWLTKPKVSTKILHFCRGYLKDVSVDGIPWQFKGLRCFIDIWSIWSIGNEWPFGQKAYLLYIYLK